MISLLFLSLYFCYWFISRSIDPFLLAFSLQFVWDDAIWGLCRCNLHYSNSIFTEFTHVQGNLAPNSTAGRPNHFSPWHWRQPQRPRAAPPSPGGRWKRWDEAPCHLKASQREGLRGCQGCWIMEGLRETMCVQNHPFRIFREDLDIWSVLKLPNILPSSEHVNYMLSKHGEHGYTFPFLHWHDCMVQNTILSSTWHMFCRSSSIPTTFSAILQAGSNPNMVYLNLSLLRFASLLKGQMWFSTVVIVPKQPADS